MEQLPYIDEYSTPVAANLEDTWAGLLAVMCGNPSEPSSAPTGFVVAEALPRQRLALKGRHWFAIYRLVFELDELPVGTRVRAQTWAAFPGLHGKIYRTLVIGSRGHRVAVWLMLARISRAAEARQTARSSTAG